MNTAIAQHLNVTESAIVRVEEWVHVIFVVVKGLGARFVSKKVVKMAERTVKTTKRASASGMVTWKAGMKFKEDGAVWQITSAVNTEISWDDNVCDEVAIWSIDAVFVKAA